MANQYKVLGLFSIIVGDILGFTGVGFGLGYLAWKWWAAPRWLMLVGALGGLVLAMWQVYQLSLKLDKDE